jgi:hypothetical protein
VKLAPEWMPPLIDLSWVLATDADATPAESAEAVALAQRAVAISKRQDHAVLDVLAVAFAAARQFQLAADTAAEALTLAGRTPLAEDIRQRRALFLAHRPYAR